MSQTLNKLKLMEFHEVKWNELYFDNEKDQLIIPVEIKWQETIGKATIRYIGASKEFEFEFMDFRPNDINTHMRDRFLSDEGLKKEREEVMKAIEKYSQKKSIPEFKIFTRYPVVTEKEVAVVIDGENIQAEPSNKGARVYFRKIDEENWAYSGYDNVNVLYLGYVKDLADAIKEQSKLYFLAK